MFVFSFIVAALTLTIAIIFLTLDGDKFSAILTTVVGLVFVATTHLVIFKSFLWVFLILAEIFLIAIIQTSREDKSVRDFYAPVKCLTILFLMVAAIFIAFVLCCSFERTVEYDFTVTLEDGEMRIGGITTETPEEALAALKEQAVQMKKWGATEKSFTVEITYKGYASISEQKKCTCGENHICDFCRSRIKDDEPEVDVIIH